MLYHEWAHTHTHTHIHKNSSTQAASQPLCIKGLARQRVCAERQTAGSTETAMNVMHRRTRQATPRSMKPCWRNSSGLKRHKSQNEQIAQICIPWMSCILSLLPGRPRLKPGGINSSPSRAYTCVSDRRGPPNTQTMSHAPIVPLHRLAGDKPQSRLAV